MEKCTEELKLRVPERFLIGLAKLAHADDRSLSEYIRTVLALHVYGHGSRLDDAAALPEGHNAPSCGTR